MNFRNTNTGILLRRWMAKWLFYPVYVLQYLVIYYRLFVTNTSKPLVIVLTIGKVGSSSIYYSLKQQLTNRIFHIHYLSDKGIETSWKKHKTSSRKSVPLHLITSKILSKLLKKVNYKTYIITVFREPVQRKLSSFFQNLDQFKNEVDLKGLNFDETKIKAVLNDDYINSIINEEDQWINQELKSTFNFNVYNMEDILKDHFIIERLNNFELLALKMESLNSCFIQAISQFFNTKEDIVLETFNDGGEKYYNQSYKEFKDSFKLEAATLDRICNTTYFRTFYSDEETKVRKKWVKS
ncbi:putative capsular polysaccharide synthesis family protein [Winogradskyella sp. KYW1333]|uniref:putative capsular polysaccharide synthesis family protein n=1 Tax=Winogradskyella sp. KYW1333 TaxID=2282123 RepID=UPI0011C027B7|nr:putative capsular polysaccharide synthesis family protein [Winogradskyella sp. KYW1333]